MDIDREALYTFFQKHPERPWHLQDVQRQLKLSDREDLRRELATLVDEGRLIRTRRRTYGLPQEMNLRPGRLQVTSGGYGFVILDGDLGEKDLFIPAESLNGAWDGDRVLARPSTQGGRPAGEIVRVVERKHSRVVGTLEYANGYAILRPDSPRLRERILLLPDSVGQLEAGSRVVVKIIWPEDSGEKEPFGELEEALGDGDSPEIETRAVIVKFDLKDAFDPRTLAEAEAEETGGISPRVAPMAELRDLGGLLQRAGFALPVADSLRLTASYADGFALMRDLRASRARRHVREEVPFYTGTRKQVAELVADLP